MLWKMIRSSISHAPSGTRTWDLSLIRRALSPTELTVPNVFHNNMKVFCDYVTICFIDKIILLQRYGLMIFARNEKKTAYAIFFLPWNRKSITFFLPYLIQLLFLFVKVSYSCAWTIFVAMLAVMVMIRFTSFFALSCANIILTRCFS